MSFLEVTDSFIEGLDLCREFVSFCNPLFIFFLLSFQPFVVFPVGMGQVFFQFIDVSLVKSHHLSHLQVESLDFFVFVGDGVLQVAFFSHQLFHVDVPGLKELVMFDVGQGSLGGMPFDFLFSMGNHVFVLSLDPVM